MRKLTIFILMVTVLLVTVVGAGLARFFNTYGATPTLNADTQEILIKPGTRFTSLLNDLEDRKIISDAYKVEVYLKLKGTTAFKAGEFLVQPQMPLDELWELFNSSNVIQYSFTIVEGDNLFQIASRLNDLDHVQFDLEQDPTAWSIDRFEAATLEGWLYPETYYYTRGTRASKLIERAHRKAVAEIDSVWRLYSNKHLATKNELVTLASVIEKETGVASERAVISSVFHNRLEKGMRLQTDPTVIYGLLPDFNGNITRKDLRTKTPYNTYRIHGLPPGPIASVSRDALIAAMQPATTELYYFVAKGDGSHYFSATLEEHNKAVNNYQRQNRRKDYRSSKP